MVTWVVAVVLLTDGEDVQKVLEQVKTLAGDVTDLEDGTNTVTDKVACRHNDILMRLINQLWKTWLEVIESRFMFTQAKEYIDRKGIP